jgi:hypothetical protein
MSARPKLVQAGITLFACMLTLAASGDDFCFVRLVFIPETLDTAELPLDDPNSDFLQSNGGSHLQPPNGGADGGLPKAAVHSHACHAVLGFAGCKPLAVDHHSSLSALNKPLLC